MSRHAEATCRGFLIEPTTSAVIVGHNSFGVLWHEREALDRTGRLRLAATAGLAIGILSLHWDGRARQACLVCETNQVPQGRQLRSA